MTAIVKSAARALPTGVWIRRCGAAALTLLAAQACSKLGSAQHDEMDWARSALERNERIQVVASDPQAHTFTVRVKDSDELRVLAVDQLVAGPPGAPGDAAPKPPAPESSRSSAERAETDNTAPAATSAGEAASPAQAPANTTGASNDQDSAAAGAPATASDQAAANAGPHAERAADAKAGSVLASGPGYTIKASGTQAASTRQATGQTASRGTPLERLHDPIICQGSRLLHIDNRNLEFDGDAVTAEDGCEIHITNSHIRAKGIGVQARAASVHIENSEIDGDAGSIDASGGAQVYAEGSRFRGLTRHMEASAFHDLGGNVWN